MHKTSLFVGIGVAVVALAAACCIYAAWASRAVDAIDGIVYYPSYHRYQQVVRDNVVDPESVKFRNLYFHLHAGTQYLCGEMNGRNRMGGYIGFRPFAASGYLVHFMASDTDASGLEQIAELCEK